MIAIDPPFRLRVLSSILTLLIPVAVTQWVLASGIPWWRLDFRSLILPAALAAVPIVIVRIGLLRGSRSTLAVARLLAASWVVGTFVFSLVQGSLVQALLGTLLAGFFYGASVLLEAIFAGSSYDSGVRWFEGLPQVIPGVSASLGSVGGAEIVLGVSRMDERGAYLVAQNPEKIADFGLSPRILDGVMRFGPERAPFRARLVTASRFPGTSPRREGVLGMGIEFADMTADSRKALGELLERMRAHGCLDREGE